MKILSYPKKTNKNAIESLYQQCHSVKAAVLLFYPPTHSAGDALNPYLDHSRRAPLL